LGQTKTTENKLTDEQKAIVKTNLDKQDILKIIAFAGTGKTTTLASYALNRPNQRFLYVAFNKSMQLDAQRKFPDNVRCRTSHALAFPRFGSKYKHKLGNPRVHTVAEALELTRFDVAKNVWDTLSNYLVSGDRSIGEQHQPSASAKANPLKSQPDLISLARKLWEMMCDEDNDYVSMPHDGYLKLYQISEPELRYHGILLDEAQDTNPATAALIQQQNCPRILVGDPHQQIYRFRGAIDAMQEVRETTTMYLTHSFRFNQTYADLANQILQTFKNELQRIKGVGQTGSLEPVNVPYTLIARTNAGLFDEAVSHYHKHSIAYLGTQGLPFSSIKDGYFLNEGKPEKVRDPFLKRFGDFYTMKEYAKSADDFELLSLCKVIETYETVDIPGLIERIKKKTVQNPSQADVILTTTHKAKGLEFDHVKLADDFIPLVKDDTLNDVDKIDPEEINLLYVAITRARKKLELNEDLENFMELIN